MITHPVHPLEVATEILYIPKVGDIVKSRSGGETIVVDQGPFEICGLTGYHLRFCLDGLGSYNSWRSAVSFVRPSTEQERQDFGIDPMPKCCQCGKPDRRVKFSK